MGQSLAVKAETHSQGTSYFEHGSRLQIPPSITTSLAKLSMEGPLGGLPEVPHFETGRRMVPYCGSKEIVRSSYSPLPLILRQLIPFPNLQRVQEKASFGMHLLVFSVREIYTIDKLRYYRRHQEHARGQVSFDRVLLFRL